MNVKAQHKTLFLFLALSILFLKFYIALVTREYTMDVHVYESWTDQFLQYGLKVYVANPIIDYPPLYMILLAPFRWVSNQFGFIANLGLTPVFIKMPAMLIDMLSGILLYFYCIKKINEPTTATLISVLYMVHPAIMINSSGWGQSDAILSFLVTLSVVFVLENKWYWAVTIFAFSILLKPTAVLFVPFFILLFIKDFSFKKIILSVGLLATILLLFTLPFEHFNIIHLFLQANDKYQYASLHAFNIHAIFGGDLVKDSTASPVFGISFKTLGYSLFFIFYGLFVVLFIKDKNRVHLFLLLWLYLSGLFMLMPRMHERYMYCAILFSLVYLLTQPRLSLMIIAIVQSLLTAMNHLLVNYFAQEKMQQIKQLWEQPLHMTIVVCSLLNFILFIGLCVISYRVVWTMKNSETN